MLLKKTTEYKDDLSKGGPMPGMRPTMGGPGIQQQQPKGGGTMGVIMPIYTIAIIIFFVYTTMKVHIQGLPFLIILYVSRYCSRIRMKMVMKMKQKRRELVTM